MTGHLDIDLTALAANWRTLAAMNKGETAAVVKADAYGLGAARVAPVLEAAGCKTFFTAHLAEAVALRAVLPQARILALNGLVPHAAADFVAHGITPILSSLKEIMLWRAEARGLERLLPAFLHVETGLNRLALPQREFASLREDPTLLEGITISTVMTHLITAETPEDDRNPRQRAALLDMAAHFPGARRSLCNSPGMFLGPDYHFDLTRPGAALYGLNTSPAQPAPMRPVVRLSAPVLQIREIQQGEGVGYGGSWVAQRPSRIATVGVGYGDGLLRALSNNGNAYFDDCPVPLVGRVSMDLATFDVTDIPANPGDMLVLLDSRHGADDLAREGGTIGYEILTSLGRRYQRRYIGA
ncbi:alanine racemase [Acidocella aminolytica]|uniref:Alanine racemase n=1 Tax=Acidocella aminolytica 101 = DSM 11237 TaxID=1120923 RepID=A0A0D6PBJ2_9PROT|nr:alanine racemase [Acidocella aminolytica]GAN79110.1 alanine racemase [Acidocella aminolytica 101 = DSM 11237]GBQ43793.1 alanine racemase [Acidocella aminolytica 101 = DSM 11237]SHE65016.1 alanine racemase [Acidocella aminolytica 101 = DSM 11237]